MGAGGIIQQRSEIKSAIGQGTANYAALPLHCQKTVDAICAKGFADWTPADDFTLCAMFVVAVHC